MSRILLVDDDRDYASIVKLRLQKEGYTVEYDSNPDDAIKRLSSDYAFDLIIMDVQMPEKNGLSGLVHMRGYFAKKRPGGFDIPVIIATGLQSEKLEEIFQAEKISDYIRKPFETENLLNKIEAILTKQGKS